MCLSYLSFIKMPEQRSFRECERLGYKGKFWYTNHILIADYRYY